MKGQMSRQKPGFNLHRTRPASSVNLGRLADVVGSDVLASSLGISKSQLHNVIRGGPDALDYRVHIAHRLDDTGLSSAWLDQPDARIKPEFVKALRKLAGESSNPAPLRRQNLLKLVRAVAGGQQPLSEALEMTEHSLERVLQGQLAVDEERFSHINPRLMAVGFPDGWLDQPQAAVHPAWIKRLHAVIHGAGSMEMHDNHPAAPMGATTLPGEDSPPSSIYLATSSVTESASPMESSPPNAVPAPTAEPTTDERSPQPAQVQVSHGQEVNAADLSNRKRRRKRTGVRDVAPSTLDQSNANATAAAQTRTESDESVSSPSTLHLSSKEDGNSTPDTQPQAKRGRRKGVTTAVTGKQADSKPLDGDAGGSNSPFAIREKSLKRAEALDKLLSSARRGAKVTLWRDLLERSLPYWGNIRRGNTLMHDGIAESVTRHLGLPHDWLDHPSFPPAKIADWVMDAGVPLPGASKAKAGEDSPSASAATVLSETPPQPAPPKKRTLRPRVLDGGSSPALASTFRAKPSTSASAAPVVQTTAVAEAVEKIDGGSTLSEQLSTTSRSSDLPAVPIPESRSGKLGEFHWTPEVAPQPRAAPGPLVEALSLVLGHLSLSGEFTDDDALRLMAMLSAKH